MITRTLDQVRRLGRLRRTEALRRLRRETSLHAGDFVQPLFVVESESDAGPIGSLPGVERYGLDDLDRPIEAIASAGLAGVLVFGVPSHKDALGTQAYATGGVVPRAVDRIKAIAPHLAVMTDVCLCQYTDHGHCGVLGDDGVLNDPTIELYGRAAVAHAAAGADVVAPSGMMDGGVGAIRTALDAAGYTDVAIMAYSVKYASSFYGPFRDAVHSAPRRGDRRSHQMDPANAREAIGEAEQDLAEGADVVMVKPAGAYLDVIASLRDRLPQTPLAAYQVSGEYAMIQGAAANGWLDRRAATLESLLAIKRAGAQTIITYAGVEAAGWLSRSDAPAKEGRP